jgi:indolepyruvate ferredoxin oxidoreductase beta subunit
MGNIFLSGVGGQGILLAAKIIADAAAHAGFEVAANEIHGMAQRGGSVTAQVRYGRAVLSPLILEGTADVLAALEHIEAIRCAHLLRPGGFAAISRQSLVPVTVSSGGAVYPADVAARLARLFPNRCYFDCTAQALAMGDARLANTLLVGILSRALADLPAGAWHAAIRGRVPEKTLAGNLAAFDFGRNEADDSIS